MNKRGTLLKEGPGPDTATESETPPPPKDINAPTETPAEAPAAPAEGEAAPAEGDAAAAENGKDIPLIDEDIFDGEVDATEVEVSNLF